MKKIYLSDSANIQKDSFTIHTKISETLSQIIQTHDVSSESFTIGLFGEWGSGKSFIINRLRNLLNEEKKSNISILCIDVWKYSEFPLLRSILFDLDNQLKELAESDKKYNCYKNGFKDKNGKTLKDILYCDEIFESQSQMNFTEYLNALKGILKRYSIPFFLTMLLFLFFTIYNFIPDESFKHDFFIRIKDIFKAFYPFFAFIGGLGIFLPLLQKPLKELGQLILFRNTIKNFTEKANFSPEQFEEIFKEMINKLEDEKFVIVFDNIDRCEPSLAYETLSAIKTFMDVKNCFYLIPCDDDAIKQYLSGGKDKENSFQRKFTEEFIDKIFQTYIRIPYLKEIERDTYIKEQLEQIDFESEFSQEDVEIIIEILYYAYRGESPRNIKRFINDYSTYFRLARLAHPILLKNIKLFTISVSIKQKWYSFEKVLIENPSFFQDYVNDNNVIKEFKNVINDFENLCLFLSNIRYYIREFSKISIGEYIHFKETEQTIKIVEDLRNSRDIEIEINNENIKILRKEFRKNSQSKKAFAFNSFISWAYLIKNNLGTQFSNSIVSDFWRNLSESSIELSLLFFNLSEEEIIQPILETLQNKNVSSIRNIIETKLCNIFLEPISNETTDNEKIKGYQNLFTEMISANYDFNKRNISKIFTDWKIDNMYLNELLSQIHIKEKIEYLPDLVLAKINNNINTQTMVIYKYWGFGNIKAKYGKPLFKKLVERIKSRVPAINNANQLNSIWAEIILDYDLLYIMSTSFMEKDSAILFITELGNMLQKIFQFSQNNNAQVNKAIEFWIESIFTSTIAINEYDTILTKYFDSNISKSPNVDYLLDNIRHEEKILGLPKLKMSIYQKNKQLQEKLLSKIDEKKYDDFDLFICYPIQIKDIKAIKQYIIDKSSSKDLENNFVQFVMESIITKSDENPEIIITKLTEFDEIISFKDNIDVLLKNKNKLIDIYKEEPQTGKNLFSLLKKYLISTQLLNIFILPIIKYINSELENTRNVGQYEEISEFVELDNENKTLINTTNNIIKGCLSNNQDVNENYLGIKLFLKIFKFLSNIEKKTIIERIRNNDNISKWDNNIKENLIEKEILGSDVNK